MRWRIIHAAIALALLAGAASAQEFPARSIRMIVPIGAGGSADTIARILAHQMSERLGQQIVIDNRAGGASNLGTGLAAKSSPDGYTVLFASTTFAINVSLYKAALPYNATQDFAPISLIAKTSQVITAHPAVPARNLRELIALAKAHPGKLTYGTGGSGTPNHLVAELIKTEAKIDILHVPFKGGSAPVVALLAGQIDLFLSAPTSVLAYVKDKRLRALAVSTAKRVAVFPDTPTISESGLPGFDIATWYCLLAPSGTPPAIVEKLRAALVQSIAAPEVQQRLQDEGANLESSTPTELAAFLRAEIDKWGKAVRVSGAKID